MRRWLLFILTFALAAGAVGAEESRAVFLTRKDAVYDALCELVRLAKKNVFVRIFVVSDNDGTLFCAPEDQHPMAAHFADLLIERKRQDPKLDIVVILDPINYIDYHQQFELPWQRWAQKLRGWGRPFEGLARRLEQTIVVNRAYPERYQKLRGKKTIRERLRDAGITVLSSNLLSNPEKSAIFSVKPGRDNPADDDDMRLRSLRRLPQEFGAIGERDALERKLSLYQSFALVGDHRKFAVIDDGTLAWNASMNVWDNDFYSPDDGVVCSGQLARDLLEQFETARRESMALYESLYKAGKMPELAGQFTRAVNRYAPRPVPAEFKAGGAVHRLEPAVGRVLRDGAIAAHLIDSLNRLTPGSEVCVYQTLITDPKMIEALVGAARRGVKVKVLTEAYECVYGHDVSFTHGVAFRAFRKAIEDQAPLSVKAVVPDPRVSEIHRKFTLVRGTLADGRAVDELLTGSANFSVHSADGSQREQNILFTSGAVREQARAWFEAAWRNEIEEEKNMVPRLIREPWRIKDTTGTGVIWLLSLFGLGG